MTGTELKSAVCSLGFTSSLPDDTSFFDAANLAILRLRTISPRRKTVTVLNSSAEPSDYKSEGRKFTLYSENGICCSFSYVGSIKLICKHNEMTITESFVNTSTVAKLVSRTFNARGKLSVSFEVNGNGRITDAAIFDHLDALGNAEVYRPYFETDMSDISDFSAIYRVEGGRYQLKGNVILIPRECRERYTVEYCCTPSRLTLDNTESEIDVDRWLCELLPLLTSYYVWMDDDPTKAQLYRDEYDKALARILKMHQGDNDFVEGNGW